MANAPTTVDAILDTTHSTTVDGLMRRYERVRGTPAHQRWGDLLVLWREELQSKKNILRGGSGTERRAAQKERTQWNVEMRKFKASCVGDPSDHGLCAVTPS